MGYETGYLKTLLAGLPSILPYRSATESTYKFQDFGVSDDDIEDLGLGGAVNRELEVRLGDRTKKGDTFELKERGPGIEALADVLQQYQQMLPGDILLSKWVSDACRAAEIIYEDAGIPIPQIPPGHINVHDSDAESPQTMSKANSAGKQRRQRQLEAPRTARERPDTQVLESFDDPRYVDLDEVKDARAGGGKMEPLLPKVSKLCHAREGPDTDKRRVRCLASSGCDQTWAWPRNQQRILAHAAGCSWLPDHLQSDARHLLAAKALYTAKKASKATVPARRKRDGSSESDTDLSDHGSDAPSKHTPSGGKTKSSNVKRIRTDGGDGAGNPPTAAEDSIAASSNGFLQLFAQQGMKNLKHNGDHALTLFIVGCNLAPSALDTFFFKNFVSALQPKYSAPSASTMRHRLIPNEAARLHVETVLELSKVRNLTLSFDGGKLRRPRGIYTVTVTTPSERTSYILDLHDASRVSHTARYISQEVLKPIFQDIPVENFSAVVSDNTANTRKSREILARLFPNLLNFQDCCHEMNLALLQINELDEFCEMIQDVKDILSYMHHSTYAMEHYNMIRKTLNIRTGLAHIGLTRFWTYVAAVDSVYQGLPAFRELVENHQLRIDVASKNHLFKKHSVDATLFEAKLMQYLAVTVPFARAIKCLESATATAADVYAYWLGIMSRLEHVMSDSKRIKLRKQTIEDIRAIANQRFNELLEDGPEDVYLAAFFLDPRYRAAPVFERGQTNPLAIPPIRIQRDPLTNKTTLLERAQDPKTARDKLIARIGICLQGILLREYGGKEMIDRDDIREIMSTRNPLLAPFGPLEAYERLHKELYAYADEQPPFTRTLRPDQTVLQWWRKIQKDEDAQVLGALAIKLFSVVPHSMADERLMSVITWLNGPRRAGQHVQTVANHLKIRQYYINKDPRFASTSRRKPIPCVRHWRDLAPELRATTGSAEVSSELTDVPEGSDDENTSHDQNKILEELCDGAKMGDLGHEQRDGFVAGNVFALQSVFLRDMLADESEREPETPGAETASQETSHTSFAAKSSIRPSQVSWDQWAPSLSKERDVNHV